MNTEERTQARLGAITRQQRRATERHATKRPPALLLPSHFTETSFLARLEGRSIAYLNRQESRLTRLLANCARLISEHGGVGSVVDQMVSPDARVWQRQLVLIQGVIAKRTKTPARRDARPLRPLRLQRKFKA